MTLDLDHLESLAAAATEGPWRVTTGLLEGRGPLRVMVEDPRHVLADERMGYLVATTGKASNSDSAPDAAFIAAARTAVPALCAEVRRLREDKQTAEETVGHLRDEIHDLREERDELRAALDAARRDK